MRETDRHKAHTERARACAACIEWRVANETERRHDQAVHKPQKCKHMPTASNAPARRMSPVFQFLISALKTTVETASCRRGAASAPQAYVYTCICIHIHTYTLQKGAYSIDAHAEPQAIRKRLVPVPLNKRHQVLAPILPHRNMSVPFKKHDLLNSQKGGRKKNTF